MFLVCEERGNVGLSRFGVQDELSNETPKELSAPYTHISSYISAFRPARTRGARAHAPVEVTNEKKAEPTNPESDHLSIPHKRPYVGVSQGTVLGFGDGFGAILWETVAKS